MTKEQVEIKQLNAQANLQLAQAARTWLLVGGLLITIGIIIGRLIGS